MAYLRSLNDDGRRHNQFNNVQHSPTHRNGYYQQVAPQPDWSYYLKPGTVVSVPLGVVDHYGIITYSPYPGMLPNVVSNSKKWGRVVEESWQGFTEGQTATIHWAANERYAHRIVQYARSLSGSPYCLFSSNCEHFVRKVYGFLEESPQLRRAGFFGITITGLVLLGMAVSDE